MKEQTQCVHPVEASLKALNLKMVGIVFSPENLVDRCDFLLLVTRKESPSPTHNSVLSQ